MPSPTAQAMNPVANAADMSGSYTLSIYSMIPSMVRSRMPGLHSIRQCAYKATSIPSSSSSTALSEQHVPSIAQSSRSRSTSISTVNALSVPSSARSSPRSLSPEHNEHTLVAAQNVDLASIGPEINTGGVDWVIAGAGVRLWLNARGHAELATRDPALLRSMHIDALKYMNMALPPDLSSTELKTIKASLPAQMLMRNDENSKITVTSRPNLLRQGVAQAVCWIVALILIIIPLMMTAINRLLVYERKHRVTQRVLDSSANVTKALGEKGLDFGDAFIRFKDTPLGKAWLDVVTWTIEGVAGGLNDGLIRSTQGGVRLLK